MSQRKLYLSQINLCMPSWRIVRTCILFNYSWYCTERQTYRYNWKFPVTLTVYIFILLPLSFCYLLTKLAHHFYIYFAVLPKIWKLILTFSYLFRFKCFWLTWRTLYMTWNDRTHSCHLHTSHLHRSRCHSCHQL